VADLERSGKPVRQHALIGCYFGMPFLFGLKNHLDIFSRNLPVAGIVDIDILKEGGVVWSDFLNSGSIPKIEKDSLASMRGALKDKLDGTGKDMKRDGGINILNDTDEVV
jgi:hypothetical protein